MSLSSIKTRVRGRHRHLKQVATDAVEWALDLLVQAKRVRPSTAERIRDESLDQNIHVHFPAREHGEVIEVPMGPFDVPIAGQPAVRFAMAAGHTRYDYPKLRKTARTRYTADDVEYQRHFHVAVFVYNRHRNMGGDVRSFFSTLVHELFHAIDFMEYVAATYNIESQYNVTDDAVDRLHRAEARLDDNERLEWRADMAAREALIITSTAEIERRVGPLWAALHPHDA